MKNTKLMNKIIVIGLFVFYMYVLIRIILFKFYWRDTSFVWQLMERNLGNPEHLLYQLKSANFIPFKTIIINIQSLSWWHEFSNLVGNIVAFVPFGVFLVLLSNKKKMSFAAILVLSMSLSLCLECLQLVTSLGIFDIDDLILNTTGGLLGYGAIMLYDKVFGRLIEKSYQKGFF